MEQNKLIKNQIGIWRASFFALATILPFGVFGFSAIGVITYTSDAVLAFFVAYLVSFISIGIAIPFAKRITNSMGWGAFTSAGMGKFWGTLTGWAYAGGYTVSTAALAATTGYLTSVFISYFYGITLPLYLIYLIDLSTIIFAYLVVRTKVKSMTSVNLVFGVLEFGTGIAIALAIIILLGHNNTTAAIALPTVGKLPAFFVGFIVGALGSYSGYGTILTLAEESKLPKNLIPKSLILTITLAAIIFIAGTYAIIAGYGISNLNKLVTLTAPGYTVVGIYLGKYVAVFTIVLLLVADYGTEIGLMGASSRVYYAMSRDKLFPKWFGTLNKNHVPGNAAGMISLVGAILTLGLTQVFILFYGETEGIFYGVAVLGLFGTFAFMYYHITTSISMPLFFKKLGQLKLYYIVLPVIAIVVILVILYYSLVGITFPLAIMPIAFVIWVIVGGIYIHNKMKTIQPDDIVLDEVPEELTK